MKERLTNHPRVRKVFTQDISCKAGLVEFSRLGQTMEGQEELQEKERARVKFSNSFSSRLNNP